MPPSVAERLNVPPPQMLRDPRTPDPRKSGPDLRREIGQAFEWALDRARLTKQDAAARMGYTDSGVLGRWVSGTERVQVDKVRLLGDAVFQEFVIALAQTCAGVEIKTHITLSKVG